MKPTIQEHWTLSTSVKKTNKETVRGIEFGRFRNRSVLFSAMIKSLRSSMVSEDQHTLLSNRFCSGRQSLADLFPDSDATIPSAHQPVRANTPRENISTICTRHSRPPAARLPRIMKISLKDKFSFPTRLVRLEFDHSTVNYYSEIDTITLCGQTWPVGSIEVNNTTSTLESSNVCSSTICCSCFAQLFILFLAHWREYS